MDTREQWEFGDRIREWLEEKFLDKVVPEILKQVQQRIHIEVDQVPNKTGIAIRITLEDAERS